MKVIPLGRGGGGGGRMCYAVQAGNYGFQAVKSGMRCRNQNVLVWNNALNLR